MFHSVFIDDVRIGDKWEKEDVVYVSIFIKSSLQWTSLGEVHLAASTLGIGIIYNDGCTTMKGKADGGDEVQERSLHLASHA